MEFLKKYDEVFASRPVTVTTSIFSNGFLTAGVTPWGDRWKKMRRVLTHEILSPTRLGWLLAKRTQEANNLLRVIYNMCKRSCDGNSNVGFIVNLRTVCQHFTENVMRRMMFNKRYYGKGRKDGEPCVEEEEHIQALFSMLLHVYAFSISDYMPCLKPLDLDGNEKAVKDALKVIRKYEDPIIDERVKMWKEGKRNELEDLLDIFISVKDGNGKPLLLVAEIKAQITVR